MQVGSWAGSGWSGWFGIGLGLVWVASLDIGLGDWIENFWFRISENVLWFVFLLFCVLFVNV